MSHLQDHELAALVLDNPQGEAWLLRHRHLDACPQCRQAHDRLACSLGYLDNQPALAAPSSVWRALDPEVRRFKRADWSEPRWLPVILGHLAAICLLIAVIVMTGALFAAPELWQTIGLWPLAGAVGPYGSAAMLIFTAGGLVAVSMSPAWWWEARRQQRRRLQQP